VLHRLSTGLIALALSLLPAAAGAVTFPLNVEFDLGTIATFGDVEVTESGGDLDFEITLDASLGASRDLHEFYFNLDNGFTGLAISSTDAMGGDYSLDAPATVAGGAGSAFDFEVNFGEGAGPSGPLPSATFSLSADQALSIADLLVSSSTSQGIEVFFAVHVQGTGPDGEGSETVGSLIPEPGTLVLVLAGLAGLAAAAPRTRA